MIRQGLRTQPGGTGEHRKNPATPLHTGCKIPDMIRETESRSETRPWRMWRILTPFVALLLVLTPTMLCAMPMTPMNMAEHECCKHMRTVEDCSKANMSSCCVTVPANAGLGLPDLTKKSVSSPVEADVATVNVFHASPVFSPLMGTQTYGSPPPPNSAHIPVLRI